MVQLHHGRNLVGGNVINFTSTAAFIAAAGKTYERVIKWPAQDPTKKDTLEELATSLEKAGMKLIEAAEEIRKSSG
jgi:hypothetical protein